MARPLTRRTLIATAMRACAAVTLAIMTDALEPVPAHATRREMAPRTGHPAGPHPDPRPGIDASHMPAAETVHQYPDAVAAFDEARTIPEILDGIRCQCGCADEAGMRSLLSCYEGAQAMALQCDICQGQARLAYRLKGKGQSLDRIRAAIDARYGA
jgi:hypothetical protein